MTARLSRATKELAAYWKQQYTFKLCKFGDENTAFYHASASARLHSNRIQVLHDEGVPLYNHVAKERVLHAFYRSLLGTDSCITLPASTVAAKERILTTEPEMPD